MTVEGKAKELFKSGEFEPKDGKTFCNLYVQAVAKSIGCGEIPNKLANDIFDHLESAWHAWLKVQPEEAQRLANRNFFVLGASKNPAGHGHLAVVIPGNSTFSASLKMIAPMVVSCGSPTSTFWGKHAGYAFASAQPPSYYCWMGFPV